MSCSCNHGYITSFFSRAESTPFVVVSAYVRRTSSCSQLTNSEKSFTIFSLNSHHRQPLTTFFLLSVSVRGSSKSGGGDGGIGSSPQKDPQIGKFARVESLGTKRSYTKMLTPPEELAVHMAKINGTWVCTTCSSNFRDRTDCRRHVESRHITTTVYRCSRVRSLKSHSL